jgi:hypothetical protein
MQGGYIQSVINNNEKNSFEIEILFFYRVLSDLRIIHVSTLMCCSYKHTSKRKLANILGHTILNSEVKCNQEGNVTMMIIMEEQNRWLGS